MLETEPMNSKFKPNIIAIIFSQSPGGCGISMASTDLIEVGQRVRIQLGSMLPVYGEVVWMNNSDANTMKMGLKFVR
jgi:hypothetical protein